MKEYSVKIIETLEKIVNIKADSEKEALELVSDGYYDSLYILYPEDHVNTDFTINKDK